MKSDGRVCCCLFFFWWEAGLFGIFTSKTESGSVTLIRKEIMQIIAPKPWNVTETDPQWFGLGWVGLKSFWVRQVLFLCVLFCYVLLDSGLGRGCSDSRENMVNARLGVRRLGFFSWLYHYASISPSVKPCYPPRHLQDSERCCPA